MSKVNFLKNIFGTGDDNEGFVDYDESYDTSSSAVTDEEAGYSSDYSSGYSSGYSSPTTTNYSNTSSSRVINIHGGSGQTKISIMKPTSWDEVCKEAVPKLEEGTILFLNLTKIDPDMAMRIVDFLTGAAAAFHGKIEKVDTFCYAVASKNVEWVNSIKD